MNRNRHMQYRRSIYRKRKIKTVIISTAVALLVLFALFIIIGTALHSKTERPEQDENEATDATVVSETSLSAAKTVGAYALPLLEDGSSFSDRLSRIQPTANAVCLSLNDSDGTLFFDSKLASSLSQLSVHRDASSLSNAVNSIDREGFYISGALYVTAFGEDNALLREVELATWGAVACEAIQEGVGDVLIIAPSISAEDIDRICELADSIHSTVERSVVGLVIPEEVFEEENSAAIIKQLSLHFNYLTLNVSDIKDHEDPVEYIEGRISSFQLELMYYKMRVLLPRSADSAVQQTYIDAVTKYNINSWMILP